MKIAVCLDDRNGMLFAGRRQSMDRALREEFLRYTAGARIWMDAYTAGQFTDAQDRILVDEDFLHKAEADDWCFVERGELQPVIDRVSEMIVYRWNRHYPSDTKFPLELFADKWEMISQHDFTGSSHERITQEVYRL